MSYTRAIPPLRAKQRNNHTRLFYSCQAIFFVDAGRIFVYIKIMMKQTLILSLFMGLVGCGLEQYPAGDVPTTARLNAVHIGDSREKVLRVLGTPATVSPDSVGPGGFIVYARNLKSSRAFLEPAEVERDVYAYYFDSDDKLVAQEHLTLADARSLGYDSSQTPTGGKELSVMDQLIQNFGRYNTGSQDSSVRR